MMVVNASQISFIMGLRLRSVLKVLKNIDLAILDVMSPDIEDFVFVRKSGEQYFYPHYNSDGKSH